MTFRTIFLMLLVAMPAFAEAAVPVPREKPAFPTTAKLPGRPAIGWPLITGNWPKSDVLAARQACEAILSRRDIIWHPADPLGAPGGGCGTAAPIIVSEAGGVRLTPEATVTCPFAVALDDWVSQTLLPAARKMKRGVTGIRTASSYACRRRNNARSGKLSEHAHANALDIAAFTFASGHEMTVTGGGGFFEAIGFGGGNGFLNAVRKGACNYFNTVLGAGSDAYHKDHMHLDLMPLRPGRGRMCH